jgi:hypothetical protein
MTARTPLSGSALALAALPPAVGHATRCRPCPAAKLEDVVATPSAR